MCSNGDEQFSVGEQSEVIRKQFWASDYKQCPKCKSTNIAVHWWTCGCRFSGDGKLLHTRKTFSNTCYYYSLL